MKSVKMYLVYTVSQPQSSKSVAPNVKHVRDKGTSGRVGPLSLAMGKAAMNLERHPLATNTDMLHA